jgi:UDP-3-O-[3-hydroxymyristoyl] glucosamine N-acyltransferase
MAKIDSPGWTLGELARVLGGELDGPADKLIRRPCPVGQPDPEGLTFAENDEFMQKVKSGGVGAVLALPGVETFGVPSIRVPAPRQAFGMFLHMCQRPLPINANIHPTAVVSDEAEVDPGAQIGPYAVVERGAKIGAGARIFPYVYVGENCEVGEGSVLYPHVVLYQDVKIGARAILHAGAVLGADGFGFFWDGKKQQKIPQVGGVTVGDDVEIGANTAIDRSTSGVTKVGRGTKLDNLIQVGHNSEIGQDTVIAGLCGISGSTIIGNRVTMAGGVDSKGHVTIGDDVVLGGRTGVTKDVLEPGAYWGTPAMPYREALKVAVVGNKAPEILERVKELEKKVRELEGEKV